MLPNQGARLPEQPQHKVGLSVRLREHGDTSLLKDLRLILETADAVDVRLLMGSMAKQAFTEAALQGHGPKDISAMVLPLESLTKVEVKRKAAPRG